MRACILILILVVPALAACGTDGSHKPSKASSVSVGGHVQAASSGSSNAKKKDNSKAAAGLGLGSSSTGASVKTPAVVVLPSTDNVARARGEAAKLQQMGLRAVVVPSPASAPTDAAAFDAAVGRALAAVDALAARRDVDPHRIGIIGEGVGAHIGAVAMGRKPSAISAAVLADIGGSVVPSKTYAPERWLKRAIGPQVLFQRDNAERAMTTAEMKRLLLAAPAGTLLEQYTQLGSAAETARDGWIKQQLMAG